MDESSNVQRTATDDPLPYPTNRVIGAVATEQLGDLSDRAWLVVEGVEN